MSKIGLKPILVPNLVTVANNSGLLSVKGPKGELFLKLRPEIGIILEENKQQKEIKVLRKSDSRLAKSLHGLTRTLIANMIVGVTDGFSKNLKIVGTGYKAILEGKDLVLYVGFSHPVKIKPPQGIEFEVPQATKIIVRGLDKQVVGETAAKIRKVKPPEVYKGKGIRYEKEVVRKKAGKAVKIATAI